VCERERERREQERYSDTLEVCSDDTRTHPYTHTYTQVAATFADLHDTPQRMKAKGVIVDVVVWTRARTFFYWRLRRRIQECNFIKVCVVGVL